MSDISTYSENYKAFISLYEYLAPDCGGCETCNNMFSHLRLELDKLYDGLTEEEVDLIEG